MTHRPSHVELKQLNVQLTEARAELTTKSDKQKEINREISDLQRRVSSLQDQINKLKAASAEPIVSEHAYLRYFERVMGFDLKEVGKQILPDSVIEQIRQLGNGKFPCGTHTVVFKNGVVISILTKDENP